MTNFAIAQATLPNGKQATTLNKLVWCYMTLEDIASENLCQRAETVAEAKRHLCAPEFEQFCDQIDLEHDPKFQTIMNIADDIIDDDDKIVEFVCQREKFNDKYNVIRGEIPSEVKMQIKYDGCDSVRLMLESTERDETDMYKLADRISNILDAKIDERAHLGKFIK